MSQRALGDKGGVSDVLWDWDNGAEFYESFNDVVTDLCALVAGYRDWETPPLSPNAR